MADSQEILIQSRMGEMTIRKDRVIVFPRGLIGFEGRREFSLLQIKEDSPFMILQSVADKALGFIVTDPFTFLENYRVKIGDAEQKMLSADKPDQLAVLVTVSIPAGQPEKTTLNLAGPIIINSVTRVGLQIPQTDVDFPSNHRISPE